MKKHEYTLYIWNIIVSGCILILVITLSMLSLSQQCQAGTLDEPTIEYEITRAVLNQSVVQRDVDVSTAYSESIMFDTLNQNTTDETVKHEPYLELTEDEIYLISQILYLEGRGESIECQEAIISAIINRMTNHNLTVNEVIFAKNQFSTSDNIDSAHPSYEMLELVRSVVENGPTIPEYITYFRAGHYHEWDTSYGEVVPWDKLDNTYFSYDVKLKEKYDAQLGEE